MNLTAMNVYHCPDAPAVSFFGCARTHLPAKGSLAAEKAQVKGASLDDVMAVFQRQLAAVFGLPERMVFGTGLPTERAVTLAAGTVVLEGEPLFAMQDSDGNVYPGVRPRGDIMIADTPANRAMLSAEVARSNGSMSFAKDLDVPKSHARATKDDVVDVINAHFPPGTTRGWRCECPDPYNVDVIVETKDFDRLMDLKNALDWVIPAYVRLTVKAV